MDSTATSVVLSVATTLLPHRGDQTLLHRYRDSPSTTAASANSSTKSRRASTDFGIRHSTIQFESVDHAAHEHATHQ